MWLLLLLRNISDSVTLLDKVRTITFRYSNRRYLSWIYLSWQGILHLIIILRLCHYNIRLLTGGRRLRLLTRVLCLWITRRRGISLSGGVRAIKISFSRGIRAIKISLGWLRSRARMRRMRWKGRRASKRARVRTKWASWTIWVIRARRKSSTITRTLILTTLKTLRLVNLLRWI